MSANVCRADDEELMHSACSIITACSGAMSCGGKVAYHDAPVNASSSLLIVGQNYALSCTYKYVLNGRMG